MVPFSPTFCIALTNFWRHKDKVFACMNFDLQDSIHAPSYEKVKLCLKDNLLRIVAHCHIPLKKDGV